MVTTMKALVVWVVSILGTVYAQDSVRPADVWSAEEWGGLPVVADEEDVKFRNLNVNPSSRPSASIQAVRVPNPCTDTDFRTPVYEFADVHITKTYLNNTPGVEYPYQISVANTIRDTANKYSIQCSSEHLADSSRYYESLYTECVAGSDDRFQSIIVMEVYQRLFDSKAALNSSYLEFQHVWYCSNKSGGPYPRVYKAFAETALNSICPSRAQTNVSINTCAAGVTKPVRVTYGPSGPLNQTEPLIARPTASQPPEEQMDPLPEQNCAGLSLTYPNWVVENFTYIPNAAGTNLSTTVLNFTVTSRATGSQHICHWAGNTTRIVGSELTLDCGSVSASAKDASKTTFTIRFRSSTREIALQQDWICGDPQGTYSRKYQAYKLYVPPLFCLDGNGGICRANKHTVQGQLQKPIQYDPATIPPFPGASRPGCTSGSVIPTWIIRNFRFEEFRQAQTVRNQIVPPLSRWTGLRRNFTIELRNPAIDYSLSCSATLPDRGPFTGAYDWVRCSPSGGTTPRYVDTWIKFNSSSAELSINQTWYCSDTDASQPLLYSATALTKSLYCGETNTTVRDGCSWPQCNLHTNLRWCASGTYRNGRVLSSEITAKGSPARTTLLAPSALVDPDPDTVVWSCTVDSLGKPVEWWFNATRWQGFFSTDFLRFSEMAPSSELKFDLYSSAFARRDAGRGVISGLGSRGVELSPGWPAWQPARAYEMPGWQRPFANVLGWSVRFDPTQRYLEVKQSWFCNDKNPGQPILFNGTWAGYLDLGCKLGTRPGYGDQVYVNCYIPEGGVTVRPAVQSRVLKSMDGLT